MRIASELMKPPRLAETVRAVIPFEPSFCTPGLSHIANRADGKCFARFAGHEEGAIRVWFRMIGEPVLNGFCRRSVDSDATKSVRLVLFEA